MYDLIIIGGGVAALSAGMYAGRLKLKTAVIGKDIGGTLILTKSIQNWPGEIDIDTFKLMDKLEEHAKSYGTEIIEEEVLDIIPEGNVYKIRTEERDEMCKAVILATGTRRRKLKAKRFGEFENKNIHYCAFCDGPYYEGMNIALIGGGDGALTEALVLSKYAKKLYLIYRGDLIHGEPVNLDRLKTLSNVEILRNYNVISFEGQGYGGDGRRSEGKSGESDGSEALKGIKLDKPYRGSDFVEVSGVFVSIGGVPNSDLARKIGAEVNKSGELIVARNMETNIHGIFGAGDIVEADFKQAIIASAQGVIAAYSAYKYVTGKIISSCIPTEYAVVRTITAKGVRDAMIEEGTLILDVREKESFDKGHIPGAVFSEVEELYSQKLKPLLENAERIIVYSRDSDCPDSTIASQKLIEMGYCNTFDFKGSFKEWVDRGYEYSVEK